MGIPSGFKALYKKLKSPFNFSDRHDSRETKGKWEILRPPEMAVANLSQDEANSENPSELSSGFDVWMTVRDKSATNATTAKTKKKMRKRQVLVEGYVEAAAEDDLMRTKSLTDEDLDELKGCLDLGFGFSYDEIPELCNTLPALELCYSMSQKFIDDHQKSPENSPAPLSDSCSSSSTPIANFIISSPGDHPEDVKARLKFWAQAVACTVRLCS